MKAYNIFVFTYFFIADSVNAWSSFNWPETTTTISNYISNDPPQSNSDSSSSDHVHGGYAELYTKSSTPPPPPHPSCRWVCDAPDEYGSTTTQKYHQWPNSNSETTETLTGRKTTPTSIDVITPLPPSKHKRNYNTDDNLKLSYTTENSNIYLTTQTPDNDVEDLSAQKTEAVPQLHNYTHPYSKDNDIELINSQENPSSPDSVHNLARLPLTSEIPLRINHNNDAQSSTPPTTPINDNPSESYKAKKPKIKQNEPTDYIRNPINSSPKPMKVGLPLLDDETEPSPSNNDDQTSSTPHNLNLNQRLFNDLTTINPNEYDEYNSTPVVNKSPKTVKHQRPYNRKVNSKLTDNIANDSPLLGYDVTTSMHHTRKPWDSMNYDSQFPLKDEDLFDDMTTPSSTEDENMYHSLKSNVQEKSYKYDNRELTSTTPNTLSPNSKKKPVRLSFVDSTNTVSPLYTEEIMLSTPRYNEPFHYTDNDLQFPHTNPNQIDSITTLNPRDNELPTIGKSPKPSKQKKPIHRIDNTEFDNNETTESPLVSNEAETSTPHNQKPWDSVNYESQVPLKDEEFFHDMTTPSSTEDENIYQPQKPNEQDKFYKYDNRELTSAKPNILFPNQKKKPVKLSFKDSTNTVSPLYTGEVFLSTPRYDEPFSNTDNDLQFPYTIPNQIDSVTTLSPRDKELTTIGKSPKKSKHKKIIHKNDNTEFDNNKTTELPLVVNEAETSTPHNQKPGDSMNYDSQFPLKDEELYDDMTTSSSTEDKNNYHSLKSNEQEKSYEYDNRELTSTTPNRIFPNPEQKPVGWSFSDRKTTPRNYDAFYDTDDDLQFPTTNPNLINSVTTLKPEYNDLPIISELPKYPHHRKPFNINDDNGFEDNETTELPLFSNDVSTLRPHTIKPWDNADYDSQFPLPKEELFGDLTTASTEDVNFINFESQKSDKQVKFDIRDNDKIISSTPTTIYPHSQPKLVDNDIADNESTESPLFNNDVTTFTPRQTKPWGNGNYDSQFPMTNEELFNSMLTSNPIDYGIVNNQKSKHKWSKSNKHNKQTDEQENLGLYESTPNTISSDSIPQPVELLLSDNDTTPSPSFIDYKSSTPLNNEYYDFTNIKKKTQNLPNDNSEYTDNQITDSPLLSNNVITLNPWTHKPWYNANNNSVFPLKNIDLLDDLTTLSPTDNDWPNVIKSTESPTREEYHKKNNDVEVTSYSPNSIIPNSTNLSTHPEHIFSIKRQYKYDNTGHLITIKHYFIDYIEVSKDIAEQHPGDPFDLHKLPKQYDNYENYPLLHDTTTTNSISTYHRQHNHLSNDTSELGSQKFHIKTKIENMIDQFGYDRKVRKTYYYVYDDEVTKEEASKYPGDPFHVLENNIDYYPQTKKVDEVSYQIRRNKTTSDQFQTKIITRHTTDSNGHTKVIHQRIYLINGIEVSEKIAKEYAGDPFHIFSRPSHQNNPHPGYESYDSPISHDSTDDTPNGIARPDNIDSQYNHNMYHTKDNISNRPIFEIKKIPKVIFYPNGQNYTIDETHYFINAAEVSKKTFITTLEQYYETVDDTLLNSFTSHVKAENIQSHHKYYIQHYNSHVTTSLPQLRKKIITKHITDHTGQTRVSKETRYFLDDKEISEETARRYMENPFNYNSDKSIKHHTVLNNPDHMDNINKPGRHLPARLTTSNVPVFYIKKIPKTMYYPNGQNYTIEETHYYINNAEVSKKSFVTTLEEYYETVDNKLLNSLTTPTRPENVNSLHKYSNHHYNSHVTSSLPQLRKKIITRHIMDQTGHTRVSKETIYILNDKEVSEETARRYLENPFSFNSNNESNHQIVLHNPNYFDNVNKPDPHIPTKSTASDVPVFYIKKMPKVMYYPNGQSYTIEETHYYINYAEVSKKTFITTLKKYYETVDDTLLNSFNTPVRPENANPHYKYYSHQYHSNVTSTSPRLRKKIITRHITDHTGRTKVSQESIYFLDDKEVSEETARRYLENPFKFNSDNAINHQSILRNPNYSDNTNKPDPLTPTRLTTSNVPVFNIKKTPKVMYYPDGKNYTIEETHYYINSAEVSKQTFISTLEQYYETVDDTLLNSFTTPAKPNIVNLHHNYDSHHYNSHVTSTSPRLRKKIITRHITDHTGQTKVIQETRYFLDDKEVSEETARHYLENPYNFNSNKEINHHTAVHNPNYIDHSNKHESFSSNRHTASNKPIFNVKKTSKVMHYPNGQNYTIEETQYYINYAKVSKETFITALKQYYEIVDDALVNSFITPVNYNGNKLQRSENIKHDSAQSNPDDSSNRYKYNLNHTPSTNHHTSNVLVFNIKKIPKIKYYPNGKTYMTEETHYYINYVEVTEINFMSTVKRYFVSVDRNLLNSFLTPIDGDAVNKYKSKPVESNYDITSKINTYNVQQYNGVYVSSIFEDSQKSAHSTPDESSHSHQFADKDNLSNAEKLLRFSYGNRVTDYDLELLSEVLFKMDKNNAYRHIHINADNKGHKLLVVDPEVKNILTVHKMRTMYDNYYIDTKKIETTTSTENKEKIKLLNVLLNTKVMYAALKFLSIKKYASENYYKRRALLDELWFTLHKNGQAHSSSCGFEDVFMAEIATSSKKIIGLQNWIYFHEQESAGKIGLSTDVVNIPLENRAAVLKLKTTFHGIKTPDVTMLVGTSPELEMALYTVCFITRPNKPCPISFAGKKLTIYTERVLEQNLNVIASAHIKMEG